MTREGLIAYDTITKCKMFLFFLYVSVRLLDGAPSTIEVLGEIVDAAKAIDSHMEVYMDGGIRKGLDVYRALAIGK